MVALSAKGEQQQILVAWLALMVAMAAKDGWIASFIGWVKLAPTVGALAGSRSTVPATSGVPTVSASGVPSVGGSILPLSTGPGDTQTAAQALETITTTTFGRLTACFDGRGSFQTWPANQPCPPGWQAGVGTG